MNKDRITCWTLTNGVTAYKKQTAGIAEALGLNYLEKICKRHAPWRWMPANITLNALNQLTQSSDSLRPPWPNLLISSGRRTIALSLAIKKASGNKTKVIYVQNPRINPKSFDLIISPEHDHLTGPNIIQTVGATHDITQAKLEAAKKEFESEFSNLPRPLLAIFIGGSNGSYPRNHYNFGSTETKQLAQTLIKIAKSYPGTLLISSSRRTGKENAALLKTILRPYQNIHIYQESKKNPYLAMLALADTIMVTNDSVSMVSEACFTGKPTYLLPLPGYHAQKRRNYHFIQSSLNKGIIRYYGGSIEHWDYQKLHEVERITPYVNKLLDELITT